MKALLAKLRAFFTRAKPEPAADWPDPTFEETRSSTYWARRDAFMRSHRPDPDQEGFGPEGWKL